MDYFIIVFNVVVATILLTSCVQAAVQLTKKERPSHTVRFNGEFSAFGTLALYMIYFTIGVQVGSGVLLMIVNLLNK